MSNKSAVTNWFTCATPPARDGFYEMHSGHRLHFDTRSRTWGIWFKPGERRVIYVEPEWRWRGLTEPQ